MKTIKIFLASSSELKTDREAFETAIYRKYKKWLPQHNIFLHLDIWEDYIDAMSKTKLQDEYNKAVKECDIFVLLAFTKVGKYTEEEFEKAFGQFQATNKPFIFTYFKNTQVFTNEINEDDMMSLFQFKKKLDSLGHFYTTYKNIEDLQFQFVANQLDKLLASNFLKNEISTNVNFNAKQSADGNDNEQLIDSNNLKDTNASLEQKIKGSDNKQSIK
jgi:hypothetical protein